VSTGSTNAPKLLVTPPFLKTNARPFDFKYGDENETYSDGKEVCKEGNI
jgi:hypothetical protein